MISKIAADGGIHLQHQIPLVSDCL
ncbi:unnamed protein product [Victoria cruziana]